MEYNNPSLLIKELNFGEDAKSKINAGVTKLANAVKSTLGASGKWLRAILLKKLAMVLLQPRC